MYNKENLTARKEKHRGEQCMHLLIVDDEPDVIDGILSGVDFKKLGYTEIYQAHSGEQAAEIMRQHTIDVLITDIEMSDMNGLSLLEWARKQQRDIVTIFCTAYSDFNYAKKAIELQAFDYYLKPIRYEELTQKLASAAKEVKRIRQERQNQLYGDYWLGFQEENRQGFWGQLLNRLQSCHNGGEKGDDMHGHRKWLAAQAQKRRIGYREDDLFTFLAFDFYRVEKLNGWNTELMDTACFNVLEELFALPGLHIEALVGIAPGSYQLVLLQKDSHPADREAIINACKRFIEFGNGYFKIDVDCYYCCDIKFLNVPGVVGKCFHIFRDDVTKTNQIYDIFVYHKKDAVYANPPMYQKLEQYLNTGRWEELLAIFISRLSESAQAGTLTRSGLESMQLDFMQMIYSFLASNNISARTLYVNDDYRRLYQQAQDNVDGMEEFASYVVRQAMQAVSNLNKSGEADQPDGAEDRSVVDIVRGYVDEHLSEELNRASLSKQVFMNPDYLAKLFKEKTGQSLAAYIKERRIERAKEMLIHSDLSISAIAQTVGYDNLSYFSSIFHDRTGLQPGEYRRKYRKG